MNEITVNYLLKRGKKTKKERKGTRKYIVRIGTSHLRKNCCFYNCVVYYISNFTLLVKMEYQK